MSARSRQDAGRIARSRGKSNERYWCKHFDILFPEWKPWVRNLGEEGSQHEGDIIPSRRIHSLARPSLYVECKQRNAFSYSEVCDWWELVLRQTVPHVSVNYICIKCPGYPGVIVTDTRGLASIDRKLCHEKSILISLAPPYLGGGVAEP